MSIQASLNADSINSVPKIKQVIANANSFEANQMEQKTLREMINSSKPVADMSSEELKQFQNDLLEVFKHYDWI